MSTLDDLLMELGTPAMAKPAAKVTVPKTTSAAKPSDDLDSLLADLGTPVGAKKAAPSAAVVKKTGGAGGGGDDLDSLLADLGAPAPKKVASPAPVASVKKVASPGPVSVAPPKPAVDDLDSLLSDLGSSTGAARVGRGGAAPAPAVKGAVVEKSPAAKSATVTDDLDSLMADLGAAPMSKPQQAKVVGQSAKVTAPAKNVDDLDALMADLGGSPAAKPGPKKVAVPPKKAGGADDLDALMADLGAPVPAKKVGSPAPVGGAKKVASPAKNGGAEDLDSLMADLSVGQSKSSASFKVGGSASAAPASAGAKARSDELDSLMDSLGGSSTNKKSSSNDLDDLMSSLSTPARGGMGMNASSSTNFSAHSPSNSSAQIHGATPATATPVSRPPAGSLSRFEDLMSTVTADMSDLSSPHATKSRGVCYHCRQQIYDECMQALGRTYHPEHFMCGSCNNPLGTGSFFELAGQAHCQRCYQIQFCPKCAHCNQAITDRCVTALDKKWHVHCFVCTQCTSPFQGNFFERDGRPYCDKCFHQVFAPRCRSCNLPVLGDCVNALGAQWHPDHFNCQFCRKAFTGTFFEYEGMPYCEAHYYQKMGSSCSGCQQPISGACVDALGKKWHPEHFVCAFCMNKLEGSSYSEKNSKPYCRPCFGKLFGS